MADRPSHHRARVTTRGWVVTAVVVLTLVLGVLVVTRPRPEAPGPLAGPAPTSSGTAGGRPAERGPTVATEAPGGPSAGLRMHEVRSIAGAISPKSVVASQTGLVFAQNMMYTHTVTVYDREGELVATIPDAVRLSELGYRNREGRFRGAPVEAAFTPDGRAAYVSNYAMYGPGFDRQGQDTCAPANHYDDSFVYRIDTATLQIDQAIAVGSVPKYVAVTPDGRWVLVANWCSYDLSVIDTVAGDEVRRIELGRYPRGIAVSPDSSTAYVALMGEGRIAVVDLETFRVGWIKGIGNGPRHLVTDPNGRYLYATLNADGTVAKVDLASGRIVDRVATGAEPRSMAMAPDGGSLYVVNYGSDTMSKVTTKHPRVVQTVSPCYHPIGVTYENATRTVWVACYGGSIQRFEER